jgi:hypothetical protein
MSNATYSVITEPAKLKNYVGSGSFDLEKSDEFIIMQSGISDLWRGRTDG